MRVLGLAFILRQAMFGRTRAASSTGTMRRQQRKDYNRLDVFS